MFDYFNDPTFWKSLPLRIPAILIALTMHEFAHGYVAYRCGDDTAKHQGRLTLNPLAHLDLLGTICLFFAPFGWAKPVPVNPYNFRNPRIDDIKVSIAGVLTNFSLAVVSALLLRLLLAITHEPNQWLFGVLFFSVWINVGLGLFNLLPIFPLDGSHVVQNMLKWPASEKFAEFGHRYGFFVLIAVVVFGGQILGSAISWIVDALFGVVFRGTPF